MYHDFSGPFTGRDMYPESGIGIYGVAADGAAFLLFSPDTQKLFTSFRTVEHLVPFALLEIVRPSFVEWIGLCYDFLIPNDFCISSIFEFCIERGSVVGFPFQRSGEGPLTIANLVPVFPGNPFVSLLFVSAFGPLPQA